MTREELLAKVKSIQETDHISDDNLNRWIKNHYEDVYNEIHALTSNLDKFKRHKGDKVLDVSLYERLYCIEHNLSDRPLCAVCNKEYVNRFIIGEKRYSKWCSISCSCKDKDTLGKSKATRLKKYGNATFNNSHKAEKTRRLKNDGEYHDKDFVAKCKATKLEHFGNENFVNVEKAKQTNLDRYGVSAFPNQEKAKQTKLDRYGDEYYNNREKFKKTLSEFSEEKKTNIVEKRRNTCIDKYGVDHVSKVEEVQETRKKTCMDKYGVDCVLKIKSIHDATCAKKREISFDEYISKDTEYTPLFTRDEYINNTIPFKKWKWRHNKCGNEFESEYDDGFHGRCLKCYPNFKYGSSLMEQAVANYIRSLINERVYCHEPENWRVIDNRRQLDIIIPALKLAIEFDGLYFHSSEQGKDTSYHLDKTNACEAVGYKLIHIFEDEWVFKNKIVKSRLRHAIVNCQRKIFARKCEVKLIENALKDKFLEKYHIQGKDVAKIRYGLFYKGHLVACMTFIKSRFNKNYEYELSRYATISNFTIVGGASRLLKHFEQDIKPKSLITYADRRWSTGNVYSKLGFTFLHNSQPAYFYVMNQHRYSRVLFQKHKLKDILEKFDPNLSEIQNMQMNGYSRIYDCGNMVFAKTY